MLSFVSVLNKNKILCCLLTVLKVTLYRITEWVNLEREHGDYFFNKNLGTQSQFWILSAAVCIVQHQHRVYKAT